MGGALLRAVISEERRPISGSPGSESREEDEEDTGLQLQVRMTFLAL